MKIQEQLFLYECANFKINNPSNKLKTKLFEGIGEIQEELNIDNLDNAEILQYVGSRLILPINEDYDIFYMTIVIDMEKI